MQAANTLTGIKLCTTTPNNTQQGCANGATWNMQQCWELLANNLASVCTGLNNSQHCWMLHVGFVCTPCCMLLRVAESCGSKFQTGQRFEPTTPNISFVPTFSFVRRMWVEFVVGSLPYSERFFSGYSGFSLSSKTNTSKFQLDLERTDTFKRVHMNS